MQPHYYEDLQPGMHDEVTKLVTDEDVQSFGELSGDMNPVHFDDDYAAETIFKKRIAHGFLSASLYSTIIGTKMPGPGAVYLDQTLHFRAPVYLGDELLARVEVVEKQDKGRRIFLKCETYVGDRLVLDGEAIVSVPRRPEA
ncbi:MaoC family dehydratase [Coralliovum pocilloporae]|uniref:MaoC family dehydratase n=1 Tax=Coralliovum pocilloporae TaxID=3066369 RepID=UPI003306D53A